ncbi:leucyl-tRNA synthetase [Gillisia sp. Hel_I_86]|uniref:leucine--tRNA ligase n=1 Tax=Gillisia sp. Hel_I_86 TaxID=1249981 RepID=UPI00119BDE01|nr:leucine--tRNA ligase [Gillisia sp. Hel_I_86]TVZ26654.1 leucyl-tRNA synthetase [Gillisia sp. Hel_I_86]
MSYHFNEIEAKWQKYWANNQTFKAKNKSDLPKFYVLDMFPYPSGAGLHVGHPLGYIASDIYARFKRHKGFNVLHPQGYDSFGLPAEQYAIQTGQHPAITTEDNIKRYREQLDQIGFSFDWSREVRTSDPEYYKWTQWIFIQLFDSWYDRNEDKAREISHLETIFSSEGNSKVNAVCDDEVETFSAEEWIAFSSEEKQQILLKYRLTYLAETEVNWCPELGTVLANDEIVNGVSERGGYPVVRKKMTQWSMRISAYAQRLLDDLSDIDWPQPLKDSQTNWIGRSKGALVKFPLLTSSLPQPFPKGREPKYLTGNPQISGELLHRAKEMRKNPTKEETILWQKLRAKQLDCKFRRQHPIDNYIVDFVCLSKKLIIEVDGEVHLQQKGKDEERDLKLVQKLGYKILRFTNQQVLKDIDEVTNKIVNTLNSLSVGEGWGEDENNLDNQKGIEVFTTRPDTIFGVSFMTLAPEHELVKEITTSAQKEAVAAYIEKSAKRSERERMADVKTISGVFTGAYAIHPLSGEKIPVWIGDYVLAGYGTGAVMSVPCGDQRDYDFAKHFGLPIPNIFEGIDISEEAYAGKDGTIIANSDFLSGLSYKEATQKAIEALEAVNAGKGKINYRLRDAVFSRQRYWGEPFPVYYINGLPQMIAEEHLPLKLPEVEKYLPTEEGEPPLGRAKDWYWNTKLNKVVSPPLEGSGEDIYPLELNTMPGWAGSSWYFFRYMDADNEDRFVSEEAQKYWENVDLYIGGSEHATGHLLYSRFWVKFLYDRGMVTVKEPFKKLINQGMILGMSAMVYRIEGENTFVSQGLIGGKNVQPIHADVSMINSSDELDVEAFKNWRPEFADAKFILENGKYTVGREVEKMSKSKYNVVGPDEICSQYGADTLRMYEMFLGPLEQAKPWNTAGITGVHSFLKKLWKLYHSSPDPSNGGEASFHVSEEKASADSMKTLHKTIKKVTEDIEQFSFNTSVSTFMICVNELTAQKCDQREVLEPLVILIAPYAPHIAEELWNKLGHNSSITTAIYPVFEEKYVMESTKKYPISFNGKMRFTMELSLELGKNEIEAAVMADERTQKQMDGRDPKKIIVVPGKIVNIVG